jgi:integrase/recombinase XerD
MRLREALAYFVEVRQNVSEATRQGYASGLGLFVEWMCRHKGHDPDLTEITPVDMERWYAALHQQTARWEQNPHRPTAKGGLSDHTIDNYYRKVRAFFRWLGKRGKLREDPMVYIDHKPPAPAEPKWLNIGQVEALLEAARSKGVREYALIRLALATGMRRRGLWQLKVSDFDFSNRDCPLLITLEKGNQWRFVAFDAATGAAIQSWLRVRPATTDFVWVVTRTTTKQTIGDHLTLSGLRQIVRRICKEAGTALGVGEVGLHRFRHTAARRAFQANIPQIVIQKQFGWRDAKSMHSYIKAQTEDIEQYFGVDRLPSPRNPSGQPLLKLVK